ncbi:MAG: ABC transporter ATP-binding protein/permease [Firmicutes bacterium]|nr:ABC transporter ATP-binding protein/permease [Bacillota bacterium]
MISIKNLTKTYESGTGEVVLALDGIDLELPPCGLVAVCGKSGSGKTTLINCLAGIDKFEGSVIVDGVDVGKARVGALDAYRNGSVGLIFQDYHLVDQLSCGKNLALSFALQGRNPSKQEIEDVLQQVGLGKEYLNRKTHELSGGQKQRVAIARTLAKECKVILADEPTGNLDNKTSQQIFEVLREVARQRLVVVITHDRESVRQYADSLIELDDGKMISNEQIIDGGIFGENVATPREALSMHQSTSTVHTKGKKSKSLPWSYSMLFGFKILVQKTLRLAHIIIFPILSMVVFGLALSTLFFDIQAAIVQDWTHRGVQQWVVEAPLYQTSPIAWERDTIDLEQMRQRTEVWPIIQTPVDFREENQYSSDSLILDMKNSGSSGANVGTASGYSSVIVDGNEPIAMQEGVLPRETNEVAVTDVMAYVLSRNGINDGSGIVHPSNLQDLSQYEFLSNYLGYNSSHDIIEVFSQKVKIVGIVKTGIKVDDFYEVDEVKSVRKRVDLVGPQDMFYSLQNTSAFVIFQNKTYLDVIRENHLPTQVGEYPYNEHKMVKVWMQSSGDLETDKALTKDYQVASTSPLYDVIQHLVETATPAAIAVSILFLVFVSLSITSFVFDSIQSNKKLIGTLRSMGVKQRSIVSIFASESGLIALVIGAIGCALLPFMVPTLGILFFPSIAFVLSPFVYLSIFGVIALSTTLAIAGPLIKHSRTPIVNIIKR